MKKVIGAICFAVSFVVGYAIGFVRGIVKTMREHNTNPERFARMSNEVNEELDNLHDSVNELKEDMFKK